VKMPAPANGGSARHGPVSGGHWAAETTALGRSPRLSLGGLRCSLDPPNSGWRIRFDRCRPPASIIADMMRFLAAAMLLANLRTSTAEAQDEWPRAGEAVRAAAEFLAKGHISHLPLDDALSRRWFDAYFLALDPTRMYFLESDIRDFVPLSTRLDDLARLENVKFPLVVGGRFRERVVRAGVYADEFIQAEHDFTVDESVPRRYATFAANEDDLRERWRKQIKLQFLVEKSKGSNVTDARAELTRRYRYIVRRTRELTVVALCDLYVNSLAKLYDRNSGYIPPQLLERFSI
jgi:carboxyl-terminal processing protease